MKKRWLIALLPSFVCASDMDANQSSLSLDYAQVKHVVATQGTDGNWCFQTTVLHNDEGWEHYADGWQISDSKGNKFGNRVLAHPHDNEQPFTRSLCDISIPDKLQTVTVSAKCNQHGFGGHAIVVDFTQSSGDGFSVNKY